MPLVATDVCVCFATSTPPPPRTESKIKLFSHGAFDLVLSKLPMGIGRSGFILKGVLLSYFGNLYKMLQVKEFRN